MRILFLGFNRGPFGPPDFIWSRAARLALANGHKVFIDTDDWGDKNSDQFEALRRLGAQVSFRSRGPRVENFWLRLMHKAKYKLPFEFTGYWKRLLSTCQPDTIVINDPSLCTFLGWPGIYKTLDSTEVPIVTICHGVHEGGALSPELYRCAPSIFSNRVSASVFVSHRNLEVARRQLCLPLERALVLDNPPSFEDLVSLPFPPDPPFRMATVARLDCGGKGHDTLLDILSRPEWRSRDWILTLAGEGPDGAYLNDLVRYYGLEDRVQLIGHCDNIRGLWASHALFVMCTSAEGKSLALTEAMVCGRPAVVTDVGGNSELVEDGVTGFVAESATFKSFARAMEKAWEQRSRWEEMGMRAHENIIARLETPPERHLLDVIESVRGHNRRVDQPLTITRKEAGVIRAFQRLSQSK